MTPCINWTGALDRDGYGRTRRGLAHRVAYERQRGPIPDGLTIDHLCRNRSCVNVDHLEVVSRRENTMRGIAPTAINARKTYCKNGHPFDERNTRWTTGKDRQGRVTTRRQCRACNLKSVASYKQRKSA